MNKTSSVVLLGMIATLGGCQTGSKVIPGYVRIEQASGLSEVRFLAKGIE